LHFALVEDLYNAVMDLNQYAYRLPKELIAESPLARRADARLLVVDRQRQELHHRHVRDLPELLRAGDCLVVNDTRVVPARILGHRSETGGRWEGLYLSSTPEGHWRLLCKVRGHLRPNELVILHDLQGRDTAKLWLLEKLEGGLWIGHCEGGEDPWPLLERIGHVPLPHYVRGGHAMPSDRQQYQTVYAKHPGSAAAPTAGLHFTGELLGELENRGVGIARVTLHVGLDTFRPIVAPLLADHKMHSEWCQLTAETAQQLNACRAHGGRVVAIGTTSVRVLETAAQSGTLQAFYGATDLFIRPPYEFRAVDALLTNFHLPRTTLLVLVRTFGGEELVMRAYEEAIRERYRFYSYGDAMLIV
jgi:S-adenosylmethionine:tRNA ribosyltransferase-isomerase